MPLKGNYSEALPAQVRAKIKVSKSLEKEVEKSRGRDRRLPFFFEMKDDPLQIVSLWVLPFGVHSGLVVSVLVSH